MNSVSNITNENEDLYWDALVERNARFDGVFFYGVETTGIYCRPTCKSRRPQRQNVRFFLSTTEAEDAGFRPCKRCTPHDESTDHDRHAVILKACSTIDQAARPPALRTLADAAGLSPFYFQRLFKRIVGITPRQYFDEKRVGRMRDNLRQGQTITEAIYDSGFGSNSRFYSQAAEMLGMPPSVYKRGAKDQHIRYSIAQSHLGWVLVAATQRGVCAIEFGESRAALEKRLTLRFPSAVIEEEDTQTSGWIAEVVAFLDTPSKEMDLPLDIQGTAFQRQVWQALKSIPYGSTASYAEIAVKIGRPAAVRAVAQACAANKIALAIPCHRAIRSDGSLGGYRWGAERKKKILELEQGKPDNQGQNAETNPVRET